jgi:phenylacetate-CoA ligase
MRLDDPALDSTASEARDSWLLEAVRHQIAFMRAKVPFWRERLSKAVVDECKIESIADLAQVPILTKEELRAIRPAVLLPDESRLELKVCRWTSGTSGRPTVNFWSETDWAALVASTARMLVR